MNWFYDLSVKRKLILVIFITALIGQITAFTIITFDQVNHLQNSLMKQSKIYARLVGEYCVSALIFEDPKALEDILEKVEALPDILSAAVYDEQGELVAYHLNTKKIAEPSPRESLEDEYMNNFLHIKEDINFGGKNYGKIHLKVSTAKLNSEISSKIFLFLLIVFGTAVLTYLLATKFQRVISDPITDLASATDKISRNGDYSLRLNRQSNDEIGRLYGSFNAMLAQIQKRKSERDRVIEDMREQYDRFITILDQFPESVIVIDPDDYKIIFANSTSEHTLNQNLVGKHCFEAIFDSNKKCLFCKSDQLKTTSKEYLSWEIFNTNMNKYFLFIEKLINWPDGRLMILNVLFDITERKNNENKLEEYREHLEELIEARTKELEEKNQKLQESNRELEKLNRFFVDREFRIKQLKDKVRELEKRKS